MNPKRTGNLLKLLLKSVMAFLIMASASLVGAQTLQTLCFFTATNGASPLAGLTLGNDGEFYGTTYFGGITNSTQTRGMGTAFKITTNGTLTTLVSFNGTNGSHPYAAMTLGDDGKFYSTTKEGGSSNNGTVFKVATNGTLTRLVSCSSANRHPLAGLTLGSDGKFYSTTFNGGNFAVGTVFKVTTNLALTTLASFNGTNGMNPIAALTLGNDGIFYGTTLYGGITNSTFSGGMGTVFTVATNGALTTLIAFNSTNGANPRAALTLGNDGKFYGTTQAGGSADSGTVFKVTTNGNLTTLVFFNGTNGAHSTAALTLGCDGNFYGTTRLGGSGDYGTVFKMTTNGTLTTLVSFANTNGAFPYALTLGNDGSFYGTTEQGGITNSTYTYGMGTVFRLLLPSVIPPKLELQFAAGYPLLNLNGMLSSNFVVQYSTNLTETNWIILLSLTNLSSSPYQFLDPAGVSQPARFYRAFMQ